MPYSIEYHPQNDYMMCRITNKLDEQLVIKFAAELAQSMAKHSCSLILNDLREVDLALSAVAIYNLPTIATKAGYHPTSKRAILVKAVEADHQFFETVLVNQGQEVKIFTDYDEALAWLTAGK